MARVLTPDRRPLLRNTHLAVGRRNTLDSAIRCLALVRTYWATLARRPCRDPAITSATALHGGAPAHQPIAHARPHLRQRERLGDVVGHAPLEPAQDLLVLGSARQHHDRDGGEAG